VDKSSFHEGLTDACPPCSFGDEETGHRPGVVVAWDLSILRIVVPAADSTPTNRALLHERDDAWDFSGPNQASHRVAIGCVAGPK